MIVSSMTGVETGLRKRPFCAVLLAEVDLLPLGPGCARFARMKGDVLLALALTLAGGLGVAFWPAVDLATASLFAVPGEGFPLAQNPMLIVLHQTASRGAWILGVGLVGAAAFAGVRARPLGGLSARGWLFLVCALLVGPGLVVNVGLKDHWGRARPSQIVEFGGTRSFSPALEPHESKVPNGSFVAGDPAVGFAFVSLAFLVASAWRRRIFWGGVALGGVLGLMRIAMGGHFLSDVLFSGFVVILTSAVLARIFFPASFAPSFLSRSPHA